MGQIKVAICQFEVGTDVLENSRWIQLFLKEAAQNGADIVHFSECALSGYAGVDFMGFEDFDWHLLDEQTQIIKKLVAGLGIWAIIGTSHYNPAEPRPNNSLYLISPDGEIAARYDKRFCTPTDIVHYMPGERFVTFELNGVKCAMLICYDLRFPELYRELKKMNVECVFQSFYNARQEGPSVHTDIMRQTMQCHAATNYFWVSMTNSCAPICPYPSCFIQPDGKIAAQLQDETPGMTIQIIDTGKQFYDASAPYRDLAMRGILTNRGE